MANYGDRYLSELDFRNYCTSQGVELEDFELEFYERTGVVTPVAWILIPQSYIDFINQEIYTRHKGLPFEREPSEEWEPLNLLLHPPYNDPADWTDIELHHRFDRASEANNPFLIRPPFRDADPPISFRLLPYRRCEYYYSEGSTNRYYHYWQITQVYMAQKTLHERIDWHQLIQNIEIGNTKRGTQGRLKSATNHYLVKRLIVISPYYNALSYFIAVYKNEEQRAFDRVPERGGLRTLSDQEFVDYKNRQRDNAKNIWTTHNLEEDKVLEFLITLIRTRDEVVKDECHKLADSLADDLGYTLALLERVTGKDQDQIGNEVEKLAGPWIKRSLRHIDKSKEIIDDARQWLGWASEDYNKRFPSLTIGDAELDELLDFAVREGVFLIPYAVSTSQNEYNEPRAFYSTSLYMGMKNIATGIESLLRIIALRKSTNPGPVGTLFEILREVFPTQWFSDWHREQQRLYQGTRPANENEFVTLTYDICTDPILDQRPYVRTFLLFHLLRNYTGHFPSLHNEFVMGELTGQVWGATLDALFYSWVYARQNGWA